MLLLSQALPSKKPLIPKWLGKRMFSFSLNYNPVILVIRLRNDSAGFEAIGPILQGLNQPVSDLSRGANEEDVYKLAIITAAQTLL